MKEISRGLFGVMAAPVILSILQNGDHFGWEMVQELKKLTDGKVNWKNAGIYPVLKQLENNGKVKSYWRNEPGERPRRYYTLLPAGKEQLQQNLEELKYFCNFIKEFNKNNTNSGK